MDLKYGSLVVTDQTNGYKIENSKRFFKIQIFWILPKKKSSISNLAFFTCLYLKHCLMKLFLIPTLKILNQNSALVFETCPCIYHISLYRHTPINKPPSSIPCLHKITESKSPNSNLQLILIFKYIINKNKWTLCIIPSGHKEIKYPGRKKMYFLIFFFLHFKDKVEVVFI